MKIERQLQGTLSNVLTELIKERELENRIIVVLEEHRADITLKKSNGKPIFFIELKDPTAKDGKSVFDSSVLMREVERAQRIDIKYFGNCNFLACAFFDKDKLYEKVSVNEGFFTLIDIYRLSQNYTPNREVLTKLRSIAEFYLDRALEIIERKPIKFSDLDELFIFKIRKLIEVYAQPISTKVWDKYNNDKPFKKEIQLYAQSQLWNMPTTFEEIENLTNIGVLMLISKLIFYKAYVDNKAWHQLHPMKVPDSVSTPDELEQVIWKYFKEFQEVTNNFELLIGERSDIIFKIPFVSDDVIDLVKEILDTEGHYNFSNIPFDIIGRIFEELIREDERHKLGQYFTPPHVIDLINSYAINNGNDKVFDPSCGSGTFLVRAYERKKILCNEENKRAKHEILLNEIYGNDLSGYPAYLSMLNLAIRNMHSASYPRIVNKDFFALTEHTKIKLHNHNGEEENKPLPKFDAIIGNPPYTRQEDIGAMQGKVLKTITKPGIQELIKAECGFEPSQRTSIYAYFFYHASVFLKDRGYLAFICQNSWLDTDYGIDMQRYLMRNYEIIAVMDSEVERFFPSAAVNTTIVILRKQRDEVERNKNSVKFIYFTSTLATAIKNYKGVDKLNTSIRRTNKNETNDFFNLNTINQLTLSNSTKWGQYLKAPQVYFDIIQKGGEKFTTLGKLANVKFGIKTGNNDFFILKDLTDKSSEKLLKAAMNNSSGIETIKNLRQANLRLVENGNNELWLIEEQFLLPMLTSPKDVNTYDVQQSQLHYKFLTTDLEKKELRKQFPYIFEYIKHGEKMNIHHGSSVSSRKVWYDAGERQLPAMSFSYMINDFGKTFKGKNFTNNNFHNIYPLKNAHTIWLYMNSTVCWLIQQMIMRTNLGDGAGKIETYDLAAIPIPNIDLENLLIDLGATKNYKDELGSPENLKTVNPERRKLDNAILEAIGYKIKKERDIILDELYKATYKLIDARLQKAQSLKGVKVQRNKVEFSVYVEQLKELLLEEKYVAKNTLTFGRQVEKVVHQITSEHRLQKKILDAYWKEKFGEVFDNKTIGDHSQVKLF
jgi:hypothetical protein